MAPIKNERYIPTKNYVIAFAIIIIMLLLVWYGFEWYKVIEEEKISTSYLIKEKIITNEISDLDRIDDIFSEAPSTYFLYISYTGSEDIYNMEEDLKSLIQEYELGDMFYYLNVTEIKNNENYIDEINDKLSLDDIKVTQVPTIIYFKDDKAVDIITTDDDNMMDNGDFQKLLDVNKISKE